MRFTLDDPPFAGRTGAGVMIAVIDSGVHAAHPHVGGVQGGVSFVSGDGTDTDDVVDRIGHGTAVAAAIREKASAADLVAIRVFDRQLATNADVLAGAITWAANHGARLINLSLGTTNTAHAKLLETAVSVATARGALVVSATEAGGLRCLPGALSGVVGVLVDWDCDRAAMEVLAPPNGAEIPRFRASGYPRPIPGVPVERNLSGVSFAVANVTGFLARVLEVCSTADVWRTLARGAATA